MPKKILLAEDSRTMQKIVELTFAAEDYQVTAVASASEALTRAADVAPDVVIADLSLPGKNGYELCAELKARGVTSPVLLLHGAGAAYDPARAQAVHADGEISKPFETQALIDRVQTLIENRGRAPVVPLRAPAAPPAARDEVVRPAAPAPAFAPPAVPVGVPLPTAVRTPPAPAAPTLPAAVPPRPAPSVGLGAAPASPAGRSFVGAVPAPPSPMAPPPGNSFVGTRPPLAAATTLTEDDEPVSYVTGEFDGPRRDTQPGPGGPSIGDTASALAYAARATGPLGAPLPAAVRSPSPAVAQAAPGHLGVGSALPASPSGFIVIEAEPPPASSREPLPAFDAAPLAVAPQKSAGRPAATLLGVSGGAAAPLPAGAVPARPTAQYPQSSRAEPLPTPPPGLPLPPAAVAAGPAGAGDAALRAEFTRLAQRVELLERRLADLGSVDAIERVAWEVVPDLAESMLSQNLDRLAARRR